MSSEVRISQTLSHQIGEAVCSRIRTAKIQYLDARGEVLLEHDVGSVASGYTITVEVPKAEDFITF